MYTAIVLILFAVAAGVALLGVYWRRASVFVLGVVMALAFGAFFWLLGFWGEMLWFDALGYNQRFWKVILAKAAFSGAGILVGGLVVAVGTLPGTQGRWHMRLWPRLVGAYIGGMWGVSNWDTLLRYLNRVEMDLADPILGRDAGFYLFALPFYDALYWLVLGLALVCLGTYLAALAARYVRVTGQELVFEPPAQRGRLDAWRPRVGRPQIRTQDTVHYEDKSQ